MEAGEEPGMFLRPFRVLEELVGGLTVRRTGPGGDKHKIRATRTNEAFGNSGLRPPPVSIMCGCSFPVRVMLLWFSSWRQDLLLVWGLHLLDENPCLEGGLVWDLHHCRVPTDLLELCCHWTLRWELCATLLRNGDGQGGQHSPLETPSSSWEDTG